jgi:hypothetical protein
LLPVHFNMESADKLRYVGRLKQMAPQSVGYEFLKDVARNTFPVFANALASRRAASHIVTPGP